MRPLLPFPLRNPHYTLTHLLTLLLTLSNYPVYPSPFDLSKLTTLLNHRTSLTILAVPTSSPPPPPPPPPPPHSPDLVSASDLMGAQQRVNITSALISGHNFNVATSMLTASGVVSEFERDEDGAGITLFIPTDFAFANLPSTLGLQALPADKKALVLKFHVLHSYYPLGSLEKIVNPGEPTLATEDYGAGSFTLNISRVNGFVSINSGIVQAVVTQTVFDQKPVAIFGVSNVLLPKEIFGKRAQVQLRPLVGAPPPYISSAPENSPASSPGIASGGWRDEFGAWVGILFCIGGLLLLL